MQMFDEEEEKKKKKQIDELNAQSQGITSEEQADPSVTASAATQPPAQPMGSDPQNLPEALKALIENLASAAKDSDKDPESRSKLRQLDRSTHQAFNSKSENAADYLAHKYQNSEGLQKLVDGGLDFAEKLATKFAPKELQGDIEQGFGQARKFLGGLKKPMPGQATLEANEPGTEDAASKSATSTNREGSELQEKGRPNQNPELTPPLHKTLDIYQQIVKLLMEMLKGKKQEQEGPENETPEQRAQRLSMSGQGGGFVLDQETINMALDQMKDLYQNSPTIQKMVDTGLNFAEKIALKFAPDEYKDDIKKGFDEARETFKGWKQEAAQEREANPGLANDPYPEPVRKEKLSGLKPGGLEPETPGAEKQQAPKPSTSPKPKGPGFFSGQKASVDEEKKKREDEDAAARLASAKKHGSAISTDVGKPTPDNLQSG